MNSKQKRKNSRRPFRGKLFMVLLGVAVSIVLYLVFNPAYDREIDTVILITLDTLRADHLGFFGYPRNTSPFLDSLAASGVSFRKTYCPMPSTIPSHASLFTSLYPIQLKLLLNWHRLKSSFTTMAEIFQQAGFQTVAFVSVDKHFYDTNLHQGFSHFDRPDLAPETIYRPADETISAAISWLDNNVSIEKTFIWIHLFDAHGPYIPPEEYLDLFSNESPEKRSEMIRYFTDKQGIDPNMYSRLPAYLLEETIDLNHYREKEVNARETMMRIIDAYDGEIRFLDTELKRLYEYIYSKRLNRNTLWVIVADHGEGLGNHNWLEHEKYLYDEQVHVPLVIYSPGCLPEGVTSDRIVELVDILPTLLELTDLKRPEGAERWEGRSFASNLISGAKESSVSEMNDRYAFIQRRYYAQPGDPEDVISPLEGYRGETFCLQDGRYKYIMSTVGEDELYDLINDPWELNNISGQEEELVTVFQNRLSRRVDSLKKTAPGGFEIVGRDGIRKLKTLGYVP